MSRIEPVFGSVNIETENPYQSGDAELIDNFATLFPKPKIFDFSGRISLSRYWLLHALLVVVIPTTLLVFFIIGLQHQLIALLAASATVLIFSGLLSISLLMRRSRDLGWSPAWGLIAMLPFLGTLVMLLLSILPGKSVANKYGPPNKPLSIPGKIFTCFLAIATFIYLTALFMNTQKYLLPAINNIFTGFLGGTQY